MQPIARALAPPWSTALRALRARQWAHFVVLPAAALHPGAPPLDASAFARLARASLLAALALAYAYGLNAVADRSTDRSRRKNPLAGGRPVPREALAVTTAAGLAAAWLAFRGGGTSLAAALTSLAAATIYSAGPRMKGTPLLGTALNAAIFAPLLALGLEGGALPPAFPLLLGCFIALLLQNQLLHERADREEDAAAAALTTGRVLGERGVAWAVIAVGAFGAVACAILAPRPLLAILASLALAAGGLAAFPLDRPASVRRRRHSLAALIGGAVTFLAQWAPIAG